MIIATFIGFFPLWYLLRDYGNHSLWAALLFFMLLRGLTLAWHYQTGITKEVSLDLASN
jgi:MATE family multidrug resistance protein